MPLEIHDNLRRTLEGLDRSFESLSAELLDPEVAADHRRARGVAIRRAALEPLVARWREIVDLERELDEAKALAAESDDAEMAALAREEATSLETRAASRLAEVQERLVTADDDAIGATILEIRAGVGGDEAALFAGDLRIEQLRRQRLERPVETFEGSAEVVVDLERHRRRPWAGEGPSTTTPPTKPAALDRMHGEASCLRCSWPSCRG